MLKIIFHIILCLWIVPAVALGAEHYILDGGSGDGSSWSSAWDDLPGTFVRGDTYYIGEGNYGSHTFGTANSGSTYIYIKYCGTGDGTCENAAGYSSTDHDGPATFSGTWSIDSSYWDIDGKVGGGPGSWESGHGIVIVMPNSSTTRGIIFNSSGVSNNYIRHVEIDGSLGDGQQGHDGIYSLGGASDNNTIQYCYIHDTGRTIALVNSGDNWVFEYSALMRPGSNGGQHSEIFSCSEGGGSDLPNNFVLRYNLITDPISTGGIITSGTGWDVYGNIFTNSASNGETCNNGIFGGWSAQPGGSHKVYNNLFIDFDNNQGRLFAIAGGSGSIAKNNIFWNINNFVNNAGTKSHNAFGGGISLPGESNQQDLGSTASAVFTAYGAEYWTSSDDLSLVTATDTGDTLAAEYQTDMLGATRGNDGTWDRGAYEYSTGGDVTAPVVTISNNDPEGIGFDTLAISGTATDAVGVTECKFRIGSAPDESNGTTITGTTTWSGTATGFSEGDNTLYVGCDDAANNWGVDSITVNLTVNLVDSNAIEGMIIN